MTASRQQRHKARAKAAAQQVHDQRTAHMLVESLERRRPVVVRTEGVGGGVGTVIDVSYRSHVVIVHGSGSTSIPWSKIEDVEWAEER